MIHIMQQIPAKDNYVDTQESFNNMVFPTWIFINAPVMTEKNIVSLIMEGHNSPTTEIGFLREKRLYHPEKARGKLTSEANSRHEHANVKENRVLLNRISKGAQGFMFTNHLPTRWPRRVVKLFNTNSGLWLVGLPWFCNQKGKQSHEY